MTSHDPRGALLALRESLLCRLGALKPEPAHAVAPSRTEDGDMDAVVAGESAELVTRHRAALLARLGEIELALDRVNEGTYGACSECKDAIPQKRLEVIPEAATCVPCQARAERKAVR